MKEKEKGAIQVVRPLRNPGLSEENRGSLCLY